MSIRHYCGRLGQLGLGLIDLGVAGEDVQAFLDSIREHYGPLPNSAWFKVWVRARKIVRHEILSRGRGRNIFGLLAESRPRQTTPMAADRWDLVLAHGYLPHAVVNKLPECVKILGVDEALWVAETDMILRAASFRPEKGLAFGLYAHQSMMQAVRRAAVRLTMHYDRSPDKERRYDGNEFPPEARRVPGGGRQRENDPWENASLREEYSDFAAACC